jgi:hypothetical protein
MLLSRSFTRKVVVTCGAALGFTLLYEATTFLAWGLVLASLVVSALPRLRFVGAFAAPLLFVIGVLGGVRAHDQQGGHIHCGLGIIGLLEPPARARHDPRVFVGEIDLVFGPGTRGRFLGRLPAQLSAPRLLLGRPFGLFGRVVGLFLGVPRLCPAFDLCFDFRDLL